MYALQGFLGRQALPRGTGVCLHRKQQSPPPILGPNPHPPPRQLLSPSPWMTQGLPWPPYLP